MNRIILNRKERKVIVAQNHLIETSTSECSGLNLENQEPKWKNIQMRSKTQLTRIANAAIQSSIHFTSSAKYFVFKRMSTIVKLIKSVLMKQTSIVKITWMMVKVLSASHQGVFGYPMNHLENQSAISSTSDAYSTSFTHIVPTALLIEANLSWSPNSRSSLMTNVCLLFFFYGIIQ